jgi:energy-coupling factor transporter ATP-binding protein EcfA2
MRKLLLIHWHYFVRQSVEFEMINFLTGKNASGKSTIIDAMQVLLLGDTSGTFFNKAASAKGSRTLRGYLLGELGDDEESGFKYLRRGRFTSYIALEFFDQEKNSSFTVGCCFDVYSENDFTRMFFRFNGPLPDHEFVVDRKPLEIAGLRAFIREQYTPGNYLTTDTNQSFREDLYGKLGGLQSRFGQLLKKAVSFDPNVEIQKFISEFVCDTQQEVDVSSLQENIRSYSRLESEERILRERLSHLEEINRVYANFDGQRQNEKLYAYLVDRSRADIKAAAIAGQEQGARRIAAEIQDLSAAIEEGSLRLEKLQKERNDLYFQLMNNEAARIVEHLEAQIREKEGEIKTIRQNFETLSRRFSQMFFSWRDTAGALGAGIAALSAAPALIDPLLARRVENMAAEAEQFTALLQNIDTADSAAVAALGEAELASRVRAADHIRSQGNALVSRLQEEEEAARRRRDALREEEASLEKGVYRFPREVLDLREAIAGRLRTRGAPDAAVLIVAEAAEIPGPRWRNVIEGYLNTQKFYLIVPPEYFAAALRVYDGIKRERSIYGTGIVDIEKIEKLGPRAEPGSLAEEISAENPHVRLFLDYTLGRVIKCDKAGDLRRYNTALTDDGMLYQNFVARAMNPERWARPAIGQGAIRQRLGDVKREIEAITGELAVLGDLQALARPLGGIGIPGDAEPAQFTAAAKIMENLPGLEKEIAELRRNLAGVDKSAIEALRERLDVLDTNIKDQSGLLDTRRDDRGGKTEKLRGITEEILPKLGREREEMEALIGEKYEEDWLLAAGDPRYQRELQSRGDPAAIEQAFPRELSRSVNAKNDFWDDLREQRRRYNDRYKMGYDTGAAGNEVFETAWLELSENKLPEYRTKIEDARNKAYEQFREDFLSRLQNNINDAKRQIDGLNSALSRSSFGDDTYRFRIIPRPEYKRYYDMIIDPMLLEGGYNLLSEQFNAKDKDEIGELFSLITNEGDGKGQGGQEDYEKRVHTFTDYRTYLAFDLEVINGEGESQRLSKTLGKKSGGETQTPFYIAVLASFSQLYRIGRDKKAGTARLIIFDEAFSKMDSERIISSIRLLRQFDFQVILSAPTDKIADIATLVDRNLCVVRDGKQASVISFDPRKLEELDLAGSNPEEINLEEIDGP